MPSFIRPTQPPAFHSAPELDLKIDYQNAAGSGGDPSQWCVNGSQTTMAVYDDGNLRIDSTGTARGSSSTAPACYRAALRQPVIREA
jgi:hypothetical protein